MATDGPSVDVVHQQLYDQHAGELVGYFIHQLGDPDGAQDVAQKLWIKARRALPEALRTHGLPGTPWLYRIASRLVIDEYRRTQARPKTISLDLTVHDQRRPVTHDDASAAAQGEVGMAMEFLSAPDRRMLWLSMRGGLSNEALGETLGCSAQAAKNRVFRARRKLQAVLRTAREALGPQDGVLARIWISTSTRLPGACWLWRGHVNVNVKGANDPRLSIYGRNVSARRLVVAAAHGSLAPWESVVMACGDGRCINPDHASRRLIGDGGRGTVDESRLAVASEAAGIPTQQALLAWRKRLALSQKDAARIVGTTQSDLSDMERRSFAPPRPRILRTNKNGVLVKGAAPLNDEIVRLWLRQRVATAYRAYERAGGQVFDDDAATLAARRMALGLTRCQLDREAGVSYRVVARMETGVNVRPSMRRKVWEAIRQREREIEQGQRLPPEQFYGNAIITRRKALGLKQSELAAASGTHRCSISNLERRTSPSRRSATRDSIARTLDRLEREHTLVRQEAA